MSSPLDGSDEAEHLARVIEGRTSTDPTVVAHAHAAREALVVENLSYVRHLALRTAGSGAHVEDLVQAGTIGLLAAIDAYDPAFGTTLRTFATKHILGEMRQQVRSQAWAAHVPRRVQDLATSVQEATAELSVRLGRAPTVDELAIHLDTTPEAILEALEAHLGRYAVSVDTPIDDEGTPAAAVIGGPDAALTDVEDRQTVLALLATLPEREQEVVLLTYFERMPQSQIAERLGISQMHVSRLHRRAMDVMRGSLEP